jgi:hypothetical protein
MTERKARANARTSARANARTSARAMQQQILRFAQDDKFVWLGMKN